MKDQFSSKLYLESENKNIGMKIIEVMMLMVIVPSIGLKLFLGDFRLSDIPWYAFTMFLIYRIRENTKVRYQCAHGQCIIDYDEEKMTITYPNINAGKRKNFKDVNIIRYNDIDFIQFIKEMGCFRIVARGERVREYLNRGKVKTVQMSTIDKMEETYIYVLEPEDQETVLYNIQKNAKFIVTVVEGENTDGLQ